jgi:predicted RNA-binding protein with PUA-like domain
MKKSYWLMKSEPDVWSIDQQKAAGEKGACWDGVRNYQAANNLKKMKKGDLCFFYHSNIGKEIEHLPLIKQSRLSVMPIDFKSWKIIYNMGRI